MLATFFSIYFVFKTIRINQIDSNDLFLLTIVFQGKLTKHSQMLKNTLNTKNSTTKAFNINLFPYLCVLYLAILKKKSQSVFHLTSGYNIGR